MDSGGGGGVNDENRPYLSWPPRDQGKQEMSRGGGGGGYDEKWRYPPWAQRDQDKREMSSGRGNDEKRRYPPWRQRDHGSMPYGLFFFGLIGFTAVAVGRLRRTARWFSTHQVNGPQCNNRSWRNRTCSSSRASHKEETWNRYDPWKQEEYEEEVERVERIKRVQSVFNRERNKNRKSYETWTDNNPGSHYQRDDWYWKTDASYKDQSANFRSYPRDSGSYVMSHHYSVLGLDRSRSEPYSDNEIKNAFRAKAKEYHPDQNLDNKEVAEAKFKEVMMSYEAIKLERQRRE